MKESHFQKGLSLMETLVVIALLAAILVIVMPAISNMYYAYQASTAARQMQANIRFARNAAIKQKIDYRIIINDSGDPDPNTYLIQYDPDRDGTFQNFPREFFDYTIPGTVEIDPGSVNSIDFDPRGSAQPSGSVVLEGRRGDKYRLQIFLSGSVMMEKI